MASEHLTVGEFTRTLERVERAVETGFQGVHARLDTLNGQTRKHGEAIAATTARLDALDRDMEALKGQPKLRVIKGGVLVPEGMTTPKAAGLAALGAAVLSALIAAVDYVGGHIPEIAAWLVGQ